MTAVQHRPPQAASRSARWAWVAVALTPVGWFLGVLAGFAWAEAPGATGGTATWSLGTVPYVLLGVIAPTAAVILAIRAARAGERSGRVAVAVSVLLLLGTFVVAFLDFTLGWIVALVLVVAVLAVFGWRSRHNR